MTTPPPSPDDVSPSDAATRFGGERATGSAPPLLAVVESGHGPPMLFQHGLCGDARQTADVFPVESFRCITVECRGHGGSEAGDPEAFAIATFTDDVATTLDGLRAGPLPVGGISMGAAIALRLAVVRPDLVSALVLARPAWVTTPGPDNMAPNAEVGALLSTYAVEEARARFEKGRTAARLSVEAPDNLASLRGFFAREPLRITAALLSRIAVDCPGVTADQMARLTVPTLIIGHERDLVHPVAAARALAAMIPASRLSIIPPKADDLDRYRTAFKACLRDFLHGHAGRRSD